MTDVLAAKPVVGANAPFREYWDLAPSGDTREEATAEIRAFFAANPHLQEGPSILWHRMTECAAIYGCAHPARSESPRHLWHVRILVDDLDKYKAWKSGQPGQIGLGL